MLRFALRVWHDAKPLAAKLRGFGDCKTARRRRFAGVGNRHGPSLSSDIPRRALHQKRALLRIPRRRIPAVVTITDNESDGLAAAARALPPRAPRSLLNRTAVEDSRGRPDARRGHHGSSSKIGGVARAAKHDNSAGQGPYRPRLPAAAWHPVGCLPKAARPEGGLQKGPRVVETPETLGRAVPPRSPTG